MAISKERKNEMVDEYVRWMHDSKAMVITEYIGLTMKDLDNLRAKVREAGGEFHIVKNTLGEVALKSAGLPLAKSLMEGSTAISFAFEDVPALAKTMSEFARTSEFLKIKGGYLGRSAISSADVQALANLPPLPVMRAQILGVLLAPAGKLVRTLAEPARQVASVLKAYADRENPEPAA